jgi:energy-coupling factor transporter ATP-binding protein EcfA2
MYIARIQVEDGFLDGLDLQFKAGLNTLIGARGTGKTSIIELLRFCFGIPGHTPDSTRRSREHAVSILGDGQVIVTVKDGASTYTLSRAANGTAKQSASGVRTPIVFSQTEIENVALQPGGRLGLIDAFDMKYTPDSEVEVESQILSVTSQISSAYREIEDLEISLTELPILHKQLGELKPSEEQLSQISKDALSKTKSVETLTRELSVLAVADSAISRFTLYVDRFRAALSEVAKSRATVESWPANAGADPLASDRAELDEIQSILESQLQRLTKISQRAKVAAETLTGRRMPLETSSRAIRRDIESLQAGAGEVSRQGQQLRERIAQAESLKAVATSKRAALKVLTNRRNKLLDSLSDLREKRFQSRQAVAASLNKSLGPRIRVNVERSAQYQSYSALVAEILKGSGLRYNELAPLIAKSLSPRELLEAAESADYNLICEATGITKDRALRFVTALREADLGRLATIALEDGITLSLLDGKDYKSIEELSTGQRCTVVLPIVLRHTDRVVIVDQPEDHIDNAFIVDTLIKAVMERDPKGQIIFSTHNANIPVLGTADYVIQMGSDGHRGFPLTRGSLDDSSVVDAISTVMEGGADAFRRRAAFYGGKHVNA